MAGMPQRRARRVQIDDMASRFRALPAEFAGYSDGQRLAYVLGCTLEGAARIAQCNPLELRPNELAIWNEVRKHTWNIALHVSEREQDAAAIRARMAREFAAAKEPGSS
jgi:hypothetical protein